MKRRLKQILLLWITKKSKKSSFNIKKAKKIIILKYDRIGDMIMTTPLIRELKKNMPDCKISVLASKTNYDIVRFSPYIDKVYFNFKKNFLSDIITLLKIRNENYDVCIELDHSIIWHSLVRIKIIHPKSIVSVYKYPKYGVEGSQLEFFDHFTKANHNDTFSKIWLEITELFGFSPKSEHLDVFLSKEIENKALLFLGQYPRANKIIINLFGSFEQKSISKENFLNLVHELQKLNKDIIIFVVVTPSLKERVYDWLEELDSDFIRWLPLTKSILDVAAVIKYSDLVITPDTSIVHIASAFNIPVISIHENNKESFRLWRPLSDNSQTIFSHSKYGILDIDFSKVIKTSIDLIKKIT